jgi:chemotaxis signal transduction protein
MSFSSEQQNADAHTPLPELNIQDLERMNDEEFWNYARQRARVVPEPSSHAEYLECKLSGSACLVPLSDLAEVLPPPYHLARLPGMPVWMAGIMAWRGETIAVVNLDLYFLPPESADLRQATDEMLLVVHSLDQTLGLFVAAPGMTTTIALGEVVPLASSIHALPIHDIGFFDGMYADTPILNISALLASLVQQIGVATTHG